MFGLFLTHLIEALLVAKYGVSTYDLLAMGKHAPVAVNTDHDIEVAQRQCAPLGALQGSGKKTHLTI